MAAASAALGFLGQALVEEGRAVRRICHARLADRGAGVRRLQDVAGQGRDLGETAAERVHPRGVLGITAEAEAVCRNGRDAVDVRHRLAGGAFATLPRVGGAAGRVPGDVVDGDGDVADAHHFAVLQFLDRGHRREAVLLRAEADLRVVRGVDAGPQRRGGGGAGADARAAEALQRGDAAGMVVVAVRHEDQLDVFGLEAQRADVLIDQRRRLRQRRVQQHVPRGRGHQQRGQPVRADAVGVAKDFRWREVLVPLGAHRAAD